MSQLAHALLKTSASSETQYIDPDCTPDDPEGTVCFTYRYQKTTLQVLNGVDVAWLTVVLAMASYNCVQFICRAKIRHSFIILFYLLTFFCLTSWLITCIKQMISPDARYLVFQSIDAPEYYNDTANISQVAFLCLFALICATMYQIDQSLKFLLPLIYKISEEQARKNIRNYNLVMLALVLAYTAVFLWIFFTPKDVGRANVLIINLCFRIVFLIFYLVTVCGLYRKFRFFNQGVMNNEIKSIKRQFLAFFIGFISQIVFFIWEIIDDRPSFAFEATKTVVFLVSFLVPIQVIILAHYKTFREQKIIEDAKVIKSQGRNVSVLDEDLDEESHQASLLRTGSKKDQLDESEIHTTCNLSAVQDLDEVTTIEQVNKDARDQNQQDELLKKLLETERSKLRAEEEIRINQLSQ